VGNNMNIAIAGDTPKMRAALALAQVDLRQYGAEVREIARDTVAIYRLVGQRPCGSPRPTRGI